MKTFLLQAACLLGTAAGASFGTLSKQIEGNFDRHGECKPGSVLGFLTVTGSPECNAFHTMHHYLQRHNENIEDAAVEVFEKTFEVNRKILEQYGVSEEVIISPDLENGDLVAAILPTNVSVTIQEVGDDRDLYGCGRENILIPVNSTTNVELGQRSKLSCLEARLYEVLEVMGKYQCFDETRTLEGNIRIEHAYKNITATSFSEEIDEKSILYFMDYSSPDAIAAYQSTCEAMDGEYSEITFQAECTEKDSNGVALFTESMKVVKFPRCYGTSCNAQHDEQWLLEDFTLRTTEERNQKAFGNTWFCVGRISSQDDVADLSVEMCNREVDAIGADQDVAVNKGHVSTSFSEKNILNNNVQVQFTQAEGYKRACESLGGVFAMATVDITCLLKRKDAASVVGLTKYVSTSYPICTGRSCDSSDLSLNFQEHLFQVQNSQSNSDFELDCSAGGLHLGLGMVVSLMAGVGMVLLSY